MKKLFAIIFALIFLCSCAFETPEKLSVPAESIPTEEQQEVSVPEETYFPCAAAYADYGEKYLDGKKIWNEDGTLTFQHENTITTISSENKILKTVVLPKEHLPKDRGYELYWNEKYILAVDKQLYSDMSRYGAACFDDEGKVRLANVILFDREGKLLKEYNKEAYCGFDEDGNYKIFLSDSESSGYSNYRPLSDGETTFWISEDEVVFNCRLYVIYYNFANDEGKILDDMSEFLEKHGKFSVYYGANSGQCGVLNGSFYYLAHKNDEKGNTAGTIWKANANGAEELFEGKEFQSFFVGREVLVLSEEIDGNGYENGNIIYVADPKTLELKEIFRGMASPPFGDDGYIRFMHYHNANPKILYSYNYRTGELVVDSGSFFNIYTLVPNSAEYIMQSPDGNFFVEYNKLSEAPEIRIKSN